MRDLAHSASRFTWVLSLFGLRQLAQILESPAGRARGGSNRAADAFNAVSGAAEQHLGESLRRTFQTGDRMLRRWIDIVFRGNDLYAGWGGGHARTEHRFRPAAERRPPFAASEPRTPPTEAPPARPFAAQPHEAPPVGSPAAADPQPAPAAGGWGPMPRPGAG